MSSAIDVSTQAVTMTTHDGTQHLVRPTKIKINFGFEPDYDVYLKVAIEKIGNHIDDSGLSDFKLNNFKITDSALFMSSLSHLRSGGP